MFLYFHNLVGLKGLDRARQEDSPGKGWTGLDRAGPAGLGWPELEGQGLTGLDAASAAKGNTKYA